MPSSVEIFKPFPHMTLCLSSYSVKNGIAITSIVVGILGLAIGTLILLNSKGVFPLHFLPHTGTLLPTFIFCSSGLLISFGTLFKTFSSKHSQAQFPLPSSTPMSSSTEISISEVPLISTSNSEAQFPSTSSNRPSSFIETSTSAVPLTSSCSEAQIPAFLDPTQSSTDVSILMHSSSENALITNSGEAFEALPNSPKSNISFDVMSEEEIETLFLNLGVKKSNDLLPLIPEQFLHLFPTTYIFSEDFNYKILTKEMLNALFPLPKNPNPDVVNEEDLRITHLRSSHLNALLPLIEGNLLHCLSKAQYSKLDIAILKNYPDKILEMFKPPFRSEVDIFRCEDIFLQLGGEKTSELLSFIPFEILSIIPTTLFKEMNFKTLSKEDCIRFFFYGNSEKFLKASYQSVRLFIEKIPFTKINELVPNLNGWTLALLSPKQLGILQASLLNKDQIQDLYLACKAIEEHVEKKDYYQEVMKHLNISKVNQLLPHMSEEAFSALPSSFKRGSMCAINKLLPSTLRALYFYDIKTLEIKTFKEAQEKMQMNDLGKISTLFPLLEGPEILLLSPSQFVRVPVEILKTKVKEIEEASKTATLIKNKLKINPFASLFFNLKIDSIIGKINAILPSIGDLDHLPKEAWSHPQLAIKSIKMETLKAYFTYDSSNYKTMLDRFHLVHEDHIHFLFDSLDGYSLGKLISYKQAKNLDPSSDCVKFKDMLLASLQISDEHCQNLLKCLGVEKLKNLKEHIPEECLKNLPQEFIL